MRAACAFTARTLAALLALLPLSAPGAPACSPQDGPFENPEPVLIEGYAGEAMEPFVAPGGSYLFFNNRNDPPEKTDIHYALRVNDTLFRYMGKVRGANSDSLDGVPSIDRGGRMVFISTREYRDTLDTLFTGKFSGGRVRSVSSIDGLSANIRGHIDFDAEISPDGRTLYYAEGRFKGGGFPSTSQILFAVRRGARFIPVADAPRIMEVVNSGVRQYAPASHDPRELFFTRLDRFVIWPEPRIYVATRPDATVPFEKIQRIDAIEGFAEAPTLSPDNCSLYYHRLDKNTDRFGLWRVTRQSQAMRDKAAKQAAKLAAKEGRKPAEETPEEKPTEAIKPAPQPHAGGIVR